MTETASAAAESRLTAKGRATRARIVEAASHLVFTQGVAGTSIEDVRRAAGVSGSQMSHYFADKACLIRAVVAHQADLALEVQKPIIEHLDSLAALRAWADLAIAKQRAVSCEGGCEFGSLAAELAETDPETRAQVAAGFERWAELIRRGLQTMHDRGDLRPEADPQALALSLLTAVQGGILLTQAMRDTRPLEAAMDGALAYVASFASPPR